MRRYGCLLFGLLAAAALAPVVWLVLSTPASPSLTNLKAGEHRIEMLRRVPSSATELAVIPSSGGVIRAARANRVTRKFLDEWRAESHLPLMPLLLGGADLVVWRVGGQTGYIARLDRVRRALFRGYRLIRRGDALMISFDDDFVIAVSGRPEGAAARAGENATPSAWPLGLVDGVDAHLFFFQTSQSALGYPPIGRPAATYGVIEPDAVRLVSKSGLRSDTMARTPISMAFRFPAGALVSAGFVEPPKPLKTVMKIFPLDLLPLFDQGGGVAIYGIDDRKLIPRIHGVILLPESKRPAIEETIGARRGSSFLDSLAPQGEQKRMVNGIEVTRRRSLAYTIETAVAGGMVVVGFDRTSVEQYLGDPLVASPHGAIRPGWTVRLRPDELEPLLSRLEERDELRILASDLHDAIRDARRWSRLFENASSVAIAHSVEGEMEVLRAVVERSK
ncbi:MAG TPA: hypothetical protein VMT00_16770 [Thermoanaerobaculia bacterium]|nr:hypothetical protein [Thermoanaerobaculia bacterium]